MIGEGHPSVILQCFGAFGFIADGDEGNATDLQQFRCAEERHGSRVVVKRIDQAALLYDLITQTSLLCRKGTCYSYWATAYDEYIEHILFWVKGKRAKVKGF